MHLLGMDAPVNANEKTAVNGAGGVSEPEPGAEDVAAARLAGLVSPEAVDRMLAGAELAGVPVDGAGGLIGQLTRTVLERALGAELDDHLGYVQGDPAGNGSGNSRNGRYGKTLTTTGGPVRIEVPRDRNGSFEPRIVPKGRRRLGQVDDMILSLYARGLTTRDIQAHLAEVYGAQVSPALVSRITEVVHEEVTSWQTRPLDAVYPIVYIDALVIKVRDGGMVDNKAAHLVIGAGHRRVQARAGDLDRRRRGRPVLGRRARRAPQPRPEGRPDRVLRRPRRPARGDRGDLAQGDRADLRDPLDPRVDALRLLGRPQGHHRAAAADLHRRQRGRRQGRPGPAPGRLRQEGPRRDRRLGTRLAAVHPVPRIRRGHPQSHLHHG